MFDSREHQALPNEEGLTRRENIRPPSLHKPFSGV
jgi:hypothetical protein